MKRVLVVDDEQSMCDFLAIMLGKEGYSVTTASSGEEGRDLFQGEPFDIVITDIRMPGIGGVGVLRAVKEQSAETPVVVITNDFQRYFRGKWGGGVFCGFCGVIAAAFIDINFLSCLMIAL